MRLFLLYIYRMKLKSVLSKLALLLVVFTNFYQCSGAQKLQEKAPTIFGEVYCQSWVAGVKGGGAGTNIFIETKSNNLVLDSVYFRGKVSKLETKPGNSQLFIGRFLSTSNTEKFKLEVTANDTFLSEEFPFQLEDNECVISYTLDGKTKYYKIGNIFERQTGALPMPTTRNKN